MRANARLSSAGLPAKPEDGPYVRADCSPKRDHGNTTDAEERL